MPKKFIISYLFIFLTLLALMSLSRPITEKLRGETVGFLTRIWEKISNIQQKIFVKKENDQLKDFVNKIHKLQLENQLLSNELIYLTELIADKQKLDAQIQNLDLEFKSDQSRYQKHFKSLHEKIKLKIDAIPARVIFRTLDTWESSLWINVGEADNEPFRPIIAKNSPVLVGVSVIGIIDYVGKHQSRVRLITDEGFTPSVRVARGGEQESLIEEHVDFLLHSLQQKKQFFSQMKDQERAIEILGLLKINLKSNKKTWYLAKGELKGNYSLTGRYSSQILKGTGFNYDFADNEGEARDLRTGKTTNESTPISILEPSDLLVTTGMDGIFPPNLQVATVTRVELLKEGDYFYELEAKPSAGNLDNLSIVFVISPYGYQIKEK